MIPTSAMAQDAPEEAAETQESQEEIVVTGEIAEEDRTRCRVIRITGTRFREEVCMSQRELDEQRTNHRDTVNDHRYAGAPYVEDNDNQPGPDAAPP
ncbi:hypothetical protein [Aurantiacibacter aquimixticola]|nr:hypothetical protein [Aurantiacibacter aquimixticola]